MDEQTLRIFLSLAETQNTRDTAAELRVNQSNVSRALARLEDEVGMALFARHGKRLELNANGLAFRADAAGVLDAVESARRHAELIADEGRLLRVGFLHSVARWMVPDVIQRFRALRPDVRVSLRQGFARDLYGWLALDTIDVALSTAPLATSATSDDIGWQPLAEEPLCIAYDLYVDRNDPGHFVFIEEWPDRAALDAHCNTEHFMRLVPLIDRHQRSPGTYLLMDAFE